jgi:hypothetical protein
MTVMTVIPVLLPDTRATLYAAKKVTLPLLVM